MIDRIASAVPAPGATSPPVPQGGFGRELAQARARPGAAPARIPGAPQARTGAAAPDPGRPAGTAGAASAAAPAGRAGGARLLGEVQRAQARLDQILRLAESGRTFSPAELLAFQAHTYRAAQELDLAGKVVEKGTSAIKQTLQTQL